MKDFDTKAAVDQLRSRNPGQKSTRLVLVLGSGWGRVVDELMDIDGESAYEDIPGFSKSTVEGHAGRLLWGTMAGIPVWCMQGRFHYYEGYSLQEVTFPIRVLARLGAGGVLLTNAAGGINPAFQPGTLMLIEDHINFMGANPLRGPNDGQFGPRFPDMTAAWDEKLRRGIQESARRTGVPITSGVYLAVSGPSFETPAEIKAFRGLGADAVGMSTVPECLVARHSGLRVAGISCITNIAAHQGGKPLSHEDVARAAETSQEKMIHLFTEALPGIEKELKTTAHGH